MASQKKDVYDQFMVLGVTMSGANTLTFSKLSIGMSIFEYAALIITRIEYYFDAATVVASLQTAADICYCAITGSDQLASLEITQPEVYDQVQLSVLVSGTPASASPVVYPVVKDFANHEGGGMIIPAQNVYIGLTTSGFAVAGIAKARVYYRVQELGAADFIELVQRLRVLSTF